MCASGASGAAFVTPSERAGCLTTAMITSASSHLGGEIMSDPTDVEEKEYFALLDTVGEADKRLLTIKGWGVTLSLAALGFGFQYRAYGLFLVAAVSSAAFWLLEASVKYHQMRYYPRMREIEVRRHAVAAKAGEEWSAPRIDWSWATSGAFLQPPSAPASPRLRTDSAARYWIWLAPHVALPHALTLVAALVLFTLGIRSELPGFLLGAPGR